MKLNWNFEKLKEMKSRKKKSTSGSEAAADNSESLTSRSVQLSITGFYSSSKIICHSKNEENKGNGLGSTEGKRKEPGSMFSKSVSKRVIEELDKILEFNNLLISLKSHPDSNCFAWGVGPVSLVGGEYDGDRTIDDLKLLYREYVT